MLSGVEKAQVLLTILEDQAQEVLKLISPDQANVLTSYIGDTPDVDQIQTSQILKEVVQKIEKIKDIQPNVDQPVAEEPVSAPTAPTPESMSIFDEQEPDPPEIPEKEAPVEADDGESKANFREPAEIAELLTEHSTQIAAFFLSKLEDENLKEQIVEYLPDYVNAEIESKQIDSLPISDDVFKHLYDALIIKPEEPEETDSDADESLF